MNAKRKRYERKFDVVKLVPFLIAIVVLFLTISYATITDTLAINGGKVYVRLDKPIRITNFAFNSVTSSATSNYEDFSYKDVYSTISLPNSTSSVTYDIEITNIDNAVMGIQSITGLPSNLKYTLTDYTIETALCDYRDDTVCTLGSVSRFQITIEYDENGYDGVNTDYNLDLEFTFEEIVYVARIGNNNYTSLQAAVNAVPTNHTETTVVLLKNTAEVITTAPGKDIILDLQGLVLSSPNNNPVITVRGNVANNNNHGSTLTISNGTIRTSGTQGAINVENEGVLNVPGGRIEALGNRQAIYVNVGGTATISGNAFLTAQAQVETDKYRGTVQTLAGGTLNILGGTIEATGVNGIAVSNAGTTTIGTEDGNVSTTSPLMKGMDYGVYISAGSINYYDGIAKGMVAAINDETSISDIESGYDILHSAETINEHTYHTAVLAVGNYVVVTFDPDGGTVDEATRRVLAGGTIGTLPIPTKTGYAFLGWFDSNGREINDVEIINNAITYTAHWQDITHIVRIGTDNYYPTLQAAVNAVPTNNTQTTIVLLANITDENIVVASGKNIVFDAQNHTISASSGIVLENSGTVEIQNGTWLRTGTTDQAKVIVNKASSTLNITGGTIESSTFQAIQNYGTMNMSGGFVTIGTNIEQGVINNENGGTMNISGGRVIGTKRQSVYNDGGTLTISGDSYFESPITGTDKVRATVQNNKGTVNILGGTIISTSTRCPAVLNSATMTIGTNDGVISDTSPIIQGKYYGLRVPSGKSVKYYDGIIRGGSSYGAIDGETRVTVDTQHNVTINHHNVTIDGVLYDEAYLN